MKLDAECCIKLSYFRGLLKDKTSTISRVHRAENSFILSSNIFVVNNDATAVEVAVVAVVAVVNVVVVGGILIQGESNTSGYLLPVLRTRGAIRVSNVERNQITSLKI